MTPCRCSVCTADRWAHRLLGFVAGLLVALLILTGQAASRSAQTTASGDVSRLLSAEQSGAPLGAAADVVEGRAAAEPEWPASGAPSSPAIVAQRSPAPWHHDPETSFFGPGLYGRRTACGLALTTRLIGVAHRTLPCGTLVEFRWRGVRVTAPVVDRGPYVAGRTWDLTGGLCVALDHCWTGALPGHSGGAAMTDPTPATALRCPPSSSRRAWIA